ncbi:pilin [Acinetobacter proteolyticus]|uniref:pilin n=1 Tax=Acinetobacter proteolyticus TaxID=1776741 RepID=UPI0031D9A2AE
MLKSNGFTLIELMVVVAILGILSAFALVQYQKNIVKSQLVGAVAELNGARIQYELIMNSGATSSAFTVDNMFFATRSEACTYVVHAPIGGVSFPALECQLKNVSFLLTGKSVFLNRDATGKWICSTSLGIDDKYKPNNCI